MLIADLFERFNVVNATYPNRIEVVRLPGPNEATRTAVMKELLLRSYDLLHFAGHCYYNASNPANSGWIFTNDELLTAKEFRKIDRVPRFIFSNACRVRCNP